MTKINISIQVLLGFISYSDAVTLNQMDGGGEPAFWNDMVTDPFFANTWRFAGMAGHRISMVNQTAYEEDSPSDYYFPTGTEQWEPDQFLQSATDLQIGEPIGRALKHHKILPFQRQYFSQRQNFAQYPVLSHFVPWDQKSGAWNNNQADKSNEVDYTSDAPDGFMVEPSEIPDSLMQRGRLIYPVKDSHSYITPYNQRDHSWNDAQHDASDEVKWVANTKTLHDGYVDQLDPSAEHHLIDGRTGVQSTALYQYNPQYHMYMSQVYPVKDSHSYISPYEQRDHSWNDAQYDVADEVKWVDNTKTLHADFVENLDPSAEYHLKDGRSGVPTPAAL